MGGSDRPNYQYPGYFVDHLANVLTDRIYIGSSEADVDEEIRQNMWRISITEEDAKTLSQEDFLTFISEVISDRRTQIEEARTGHGMIFYLWFDEQACQLRFNLISDFHRRLPFECRLEPLGSPEPIIRSFLESSYHGGIPWSEVEEVLPGEEIPEVTPAQFVLPVYTDIIPHR